MFCREELYTSLIKYFQVTLYVIINLYLIQIEFVAKFITPINQQGTAARFSEVPKVTKVPK